MAFQHWVAYDLYGRCKQDTAGQLRCPLLGCSTAFESLGLCLQHLTSCAWLFNSWYWCPRCNSPECFADSDPTLISPHKVEPPCEVPDCAALPAQRSPIAKFTTARFWKHIRNKSNILSPHQIVPMFRFSRGEDVVTPSGHSPSGNATRFAPNAPVRYDALSATGAFDKDSKTADLSELESPPYLLDKCNDLMQCSELESTPYDSSGGGWFDQRPELESPSDMDIYTVLAPSPALRFQTYELDNILQFGELLDYKLPPVDETSELQGDQHCTERSSEMTKATELPNNELGYSQIMELTRSTPSYTKTHYGWAPHKPSSADNSPQPGLTWDPDQRLVIAGASVAEPPPINDSGVARSGPPFQPLGTVPSTFTIPRHEGPNNMLPIDDASTPRSTPFDQFSSQEFQEMDSASMSLDVDDRQELEMAECIGGQSRRETVGRHSYSQSHLSADYSETPNQIIPRYHDQYLLRTNNPIIPYPPRELHLTQEGENHLSSSGIPASYGAPNRILYPVYSRLKGACPGSTHQQEDSPISPPAPSDNTISPSCSIVSWLSSAGGGEVPFTHSNPIIVPPVTAVELPSPPIEPTSTEVVPVASSTHSSFRVTAQYQTSPPGGTIQCPKCGTPFKGSVQDRKQNLQRHVRYSCHGGPREHFTCSIDGCKSVFTRPDNLKKHQKEHQGVPALQRSNAHIRRRNA